MTLAGLAMDLTGRAAEMGRETEMADLTGRATAPVGLVVLMAQLAPAILAMETAAWIRRDPPHSQPFRNRR
jgi:hypothetical protein